MTRIIAPFVLICLAACGTDIISVNNGLDDNVDQPADNGSTEPSEDTGTSVSSEDTAAPADDSAENGTGYTDADGDGRSSQIDCDDQNPEVYPEALDDTCDGIDQDCDGVDGNDASTDAAPPPSGQSECGGVDEDGDGYLTVNGRGDTVDCDDTDATVHPGATETENGVDDDCDGMIDEGTDTGPVPNDADGDGYEDLVDCDDTDATVHPGAAEVVGDGIDQDCNGTDLIDEDCDGYTATVDCDDTDAWVHPGALESDNGIDDDCDGEIDEGFDTEPVDADGDGYASSEDCDDSDASVNPGATESDNGIDDDCDGSIDEGFGTWPTDADGDGYADTADCDDTDSAINPAASEVFNDSVDNNCDGQEDEATSLYLIAEYSHNVDMELSIWTWSDGDEITTGTRWVYYDDVEDDTQIVAELSMDEYPMDCGFRFSITVNDSSWSCQASAMDGVNFDFLVWTAQTDWIDETDLEVWIADASTGSCSLYVQTNPSSVCDPVDDT